MLTREELAEMRMRCERNYWKQTREDVRKLLDFAEQLLPLRDALLKMEAARKALGPEATDETYSAYLRASSIFWDIAHKLAETDAEVKP